MPAVNTAKRQSYSLTFKLAVIKAAKVIHGINLQKNQQQKISYKLVQCMLGVSKSGLSAYKPGLHRSLFCIKA